MTDAELDVLESHLSTVDMDRSTWVPMGDRVDLSGARLAIKQLRGELSEARMREADWRELDSVCRTSGPIERERELRSALGLDW